MGRNDKRINQLTPSSDAFKGTDLIPIWSNNRTEHNTVESLVSYVNTSNNVPKVYKALLTQTGTTAPVATVLVNTLSDTPVWSYNGAGDYRLTLVGEWTSKTAIIKESIPLYFNGIGYSAFTFTSRRIDSDTLQFYSSNYSTLSDTDGLLTSTLVIIEVYP